MCASRWTSTSNPGARRAQATASTCAGRAVPNKRTRRRCRRDGREPSDRRRDTRRWRGESDGGLRQGRRATLRSASSWRVATGGRGRGARLRLAAANPQCQASARRPRCSATRYGCAPGRRGAGKSSIARASGTCGSNPPTPSNAALVTQVVQAATAGTVPGLHSRASVDRQPRPSAHGVPSWSGPRPICRVHVPEPSRSMLPTRPACGWPVSGTAARSHPGSSVCPGRTNARTSPALTDAIVLKANGSRWPPMEAERQAMPRAPNVRCNSSSAPDAGTTTSSRAWRGPARRRPAPSRPMRRDRRQGRQAD